MANPTGRAGAGGASFPKWQVGRVNRALPVVKILAPRVAMPTASGCWNGTGWLAGWLEMAGLMELVHKMLHVQ